MNGLLLAGRCPVRRSTYTVVQYDPARSPDDQITLLWEPEVEPLLRCNIWHVRGRDKDLLVDTGLGVCSLREAARDWLKGV